MRETLLPTRRPRQAIGELAEHILIRPLGVQPQPDREVRHHPRRQRPMTPLSTARSSDHLTDQTRRRHPGPPPPPPQRGAPAGTPGSTPPPTPGRTTDDPIPASPIQNEACHQTTLMEP